MSFRLAFTPVAESQIQETYDYYFDEVNENVAEMFFDDLQEAYNALSLNPFYQVRSKNYRAKPLRKFPYLLFFEIIEEKRVVKILSLFHTSENPTKWPK